MTKLQYIRLRRSGINPPPEYYYPEYQHRILVKGGTPMPLGKYTERFNLEWGTDDDDEKEELTKIATEFNDNLFGIKPEK